MTDSLGNIDCEHSTDLEQIRRVTCVTVTAHHSQLLHDSFRHQWGCTLFLRDDVLHLDGACQHVTTTVDANREGFRHGIRLQDQLMKEREPGGEGGLQSASAILYGITY